MEEPAELEQPTEVDTTTVPIEGDTTANPSNQTAITQRLIT